MFFVGTYEQTIDSKNRLSIPHAIRQKINYETDGRGLYVAPGRTKGTLAIYPEKYFERLCDLGVSPDDLSEEAYKWWQFQFSQSVLLDPDSQGRILIPERLLKRAGIGREVALIGAKTHLELWDREQFERFQDEQWSTYTERQTEVKRELRQLKAAQTSGGSADSEHE